MSNAVELAKCHADPAYFTHHFGLIDDAQGLGDGSGAMPFTLWPAQVQVLWTLLIQRLVLILKARQLGISWLCCAYALWLCLFQPGKVVLIFSKGQGEADEMLQRVKRLYERLPEWMREASPALVTDNTTELEWANGSRVKSLPATKGAGRSFTASLVILDEAAFLLWATQLYTALKPTIDGGGQLIVLSTANGIGNLFHQLWLKAISAKNRFTTIFLPWWARPTRDAAWYQHQLEEYTDPDMVRQEYPSTAQEAFLVSGRTRFKMPWLLKQNPSDGLAAEALPDALAILDGVTMYRLPEQGRRYILAADVAEGLEHGDFCAATLIDAVSWEEMANVHGKWEPDEYARILMALSDVYGATVAVERNNHGHAVLTTMKLAGFTRIVYGLDGRAGWLTNAQTKPQMIDLLATALRDVLVTIRNQTALNELAIYRILKNGTTGAPAGYHDDFVMAWAIALMVASQPTEVEDEAIAGSWNSY
jgi:hypothetical protein